MSGRYKVCMGPRGIRVGMWGYAGFAGYGVTVVDFRYWVLGSIITHSKVAF